ncbi:MAG: phosphoribosylaminoimidazolesuccinocarboxamide synthase [Polyangiales bacterium]
MPLSAEVLRAALPHCLAQSHCPALGTPRRGKVRDIYPLPDGRLAWVTTDRISAFDQAIGTLPFKGQVLTWTAAHNFGALADIAPHHLLSVPDPNVLVVQACAPLPVEFVVRAYLTGVTATSIWTHYKAGGREFCGHRLPEGLRQYEALPAPILTPSTKAAAGGHDRSLSRAELLRAGTITAADFDACAALALALFARGQALCAAQGLMLVDTKYEFGRDADGTLRLIDEVHTPDSSRFWYSESYAARLAAGKAPESFDKEFVRRWLVAHRAAAGAPWPALSDAVRIGAADRYIRAAETICAASFVPDEAEPSARVATALAALAGETT